MVQRFLFPLVTLVVVLNIVLMGSIIPNVLHVSEDESQRLVWNNITVDINNCSNEQVPSDLFVPIFVLVRDRVSSLRMSLASYDRSLRTGFEIIILDHFSSYPPMMQYLEGLKQRNTTVISLKKRSWAEALGEVDMIAQEYLDRHPEVGYYVITDPDIAFLRSLPDVLLFYAAVLQSCPAITVIGPSLQISDIPSSYTGQFNGNAVYDWEKKFWKDVPNIATWNGVGYHVTFAPIDTTFAMRRRNTHFRRLDAPCLRAYAPYGAVHVDWYFNSTNQTADKAYYTKHSSDVNNW